MNATTYANPIRSCFAVIFVATLVSCSYRTLEGNLQPVYFSAADVVFTDTAFPIHSVAYNNLKHLGVPCLELCDLEKGKLCTAYIAQPTIFYMANTPFLVYPREHIFITADSSNYYSPTFSTVAKNKQRDNELLVLKAFEKLEKRPGLPLLQENNYSAMLDAEKELQIQIAPAEEAAQKLFDSLCGAYNVSPAFRALTKTYVLNRYHFDVIGFYNTYKDTLIAHQVYWEKLRALLPRLNQLTTPGQFNINEENGANYLYTSLFPDNGIRNMSERGGFRQCFDSVAATFSGPARDYLLSRLMYRALAAGRPINPRYRKRYRNYSLNKAYRKIITRARRMQKRISQDDSTVPNELTGTDGATKIKLEDLLSRYKGKPVLVDFWASWCVPCLKEMPALEALKQKYPSEKIAFLSVSIDDNVNDWINRLHQVKGDSLTNYRLLNKNHAAIMKEIGLSSIPRFVLYDKNGEIINADAPFPGEARLKDLLDRTVSP